MYVARRYFSIKIENIDPHFYQDELDATNSKACYTIPCEKFNLYGVYYDEELQKFVRMDHCVAQQISPRFDHLSTHTSGGRLRFATDSSVIGISVTLFGDEDRDFCTVDRLHPNDLGFYRIAKVIRELYQQLGL